MQFARGHTHTLLFISNSHLINTHAQNLLAHGTKCTVKVGGGCNVCRRIWALLQIHARQCRRANCQVPKCRQLKEQLRNIELQQAAMDERRRVAMNEQCESLFLFSTLSTFSLFFFCAMFYMSLLSLTL
jgi:hypothetical protein